MTSYSEPAALPDRVDVVVVGAGISGIDAAYRLQTECRGLSYVVLEGREDLGGTWDLFRYPGIRSDSDIFTLGFPFHPWTSADSIAEGADILDYLRDTAKQFGIDNHIRFRTAVKSADWSSTDACWTLTVEQPAPEVGYRRHTLQCSFLYTCTGYYDYERGHNPDLPGLDTFTGVVAHPQFWPEHLDYTNKKVVVIGSGATAISMVPALARDAEHVTMLQRSPTWISAIGRRDKFADRWRQRLPARWAHKLIRFRNVSFANGFYHYCRWFPDRARRLLTESATRRLGPDAVREHFTPAYAPWDQRLCFAVDADLFKAIRAGDADVVTDHIESFVPEGILLRSGTVLPADIVVTATGLKLQSLGHIELRVDGTPIEPGQHTLWRGAMLSDVPNFALCVGYVNVSWTMRADLTARLVCRVVEHMRRENLASVTVPAESGVNRRPLIDLKSGYAERGGHQFPSVGDRGRWSMSKTYFLDAAAVARANLRRELRGVPRRDTTSAATNRDAGVRS
ncbi:flavin-containing monooxygenase [Nocardia fusca]|uniref:flavin-containing monooxygenase n=1 Tax=Nocardia fusca TaxID=941183 RepID=UPI0037CBB183